MQTFPLVNSVICPFKDLGVFYSDLQCANLLVYPSDLMARRKLMWGWLQTMMLWMLPTRFVLQDKSFFTEDILWFCRIVSSFLVWLVQLLYISKCNTGGKIATIFWNMCQCCFPSYFEWNGIPVDLYQMLFERVPKTLLVETNCHSFDVLNVTCSCAKFLLHPIVDEYCWV